MIPVQRSTLYRFPFHYYYYQHQHLHCSNTRMCAVCCRRYYTQSILPLSLCAPNVYPMYTDTQHAMLNERLYYVCLGFFHNSFMRMKPIEMYFIWIFSSCLRISSLCAKFNFLGLCRCVYRIQATHMAYDMNCFGCSIQHRLLDACTLYNPHNLSANKCLQTHTNR